MPDVLAVPLPIQDDAALVARVRAGDPEAEADLALRFGPRMRALCLARTRRPDLANDLAQDAMIALLLELRRGGLRDPAALPAFAAGIARNIVRSEHRASTRHDIQALDMDVAQASAEAADVRRIDVERALERLPGADQQVLRLILVEGCKPADLAARLGISAEAARTRKLRAQRRLMEVFGSPPPSRSPVSEPPSLR
ncbi:sigma-70 family RNA polymerase sigma factor [Luteitalea sp.]|uniref:RNA polymerase sigma factor n=1 Tax=Luteitalea sp. TaxID=2004800 RepID=UPI0025C0A4DC|nr:sigma-70 family RNA polymerase sigma factor [Luteitalea sp.]